MQWCLRLSSPLCSLPSALHDSFSSGLCTKLRLSNLRFLSCPCTQADGGDPSSPVGHADAWREPFSPMSMLAWESHPTALLSHLAACPCGMRGRAGSPGDAPKTGWRELGHRERHAEGCRAHEKSRGGSWGAQKYRWGLSEKPVESPGEQGEALGRLWAH